MMREGKTGFPLPAGSPSLSLNDALFFSAWAREELNLHPFRDRLLRPARLPISPLAQKMRRDGIGASARLTARSGRPLARLRSPLASSRLHLILRAHFDSIDTCNEMRRDGIEPSTLGLRVPCSAD